MLLSLSLLVLTHELGHLGFSKLFHTRVRRFYIFFNWKFSILKAKKFGGKWHFLFFNAKTPDSWDEKNLAPKDQDNTLWGIGWIPLGGYCDIAGMIDESKDANDLPAEPQFRDKSPLCNTDKPFCRKCPAPDRRERYPERPAPPYAAQDRSEAISYRFCRSSGRSASAFRVLCRWRRVPPSTRPSCVPSGE